MKIVMLGHTGAGKTTFVSLMYRQMQDDVGGFSLTTSNRTHHRQLMRDAEDVLRGSYPDATHQRTKYELTLTYGGDEVLPITWKDYRGGALYDRSSAKDAAKLHRDLTESEGIVVLVDAVSLVKEDAAADDVRRLVQLMLPALQSRDEVLTPVVIAFTKCDLVDTEDVAVIEALCGPFAPLVDAVSATQHISGTFVGIACGPDPVNVVVPVLWAVRFGVIGLAMRREVAAEEAWQIANEAAAGANWIDSLTKTMDGMETERQRSRRYYAMAQAELNEIEPLVGPANALDELLSEISGF